jgi:hypothetical protein
VSRSGGWAEEEAGCGRHGAVSGWVGKETGNSVDGVLPGFPLWAVVKEIVGWTRYCVWASL